MKYINYNYFFLMKNYIYLYRNFETKVTARKIMNSSIPFVHLEFASCKLASCKQMKWALMVYYNGHP